LFLLYNDEEGRKPSVDAIIKYDVVILFKTGYGEGCDIEAADSVAITCNKSLNMEKLD
jgi:hypothetical protein